MLDTISYIPTILAYTFITLLVAILCFIVIYVSHKVYISIYDNLPVVQSTTSYRYTTGNAGLHDSASTSSRKSRSALRIIVTLEPCYLAFVVFETEQPILPTTMRMLMLGASRQMPTSNVRSNLSQLTQGTLNFPSMLELKPEYDQCQLLQPQTKLVKYYDRLSAIPMVDTCLEENAPRPNMLNNVINAMVLQNVLHPRRTSKPSVQRLPYLNTSDGRRSREHKVSIHAPRQRQRSPPMSPPTM